MPQMEGEVVTGLLHAVRKGDEKAEGLLIGCVYQELRRLAGGLMRNERSDHTLQPTALVHEAYIRLLKGSKVDYKDRRHFYAVAARQMRRMLIDHAREKRAAKRGAGAVKVELGEVDGSHVVRREDVLAVDVALDDLEKLDPRAAKVVELRFFGGLTDKEAAEVLRVPVATTRRDWEFARAWLIKRLA
jgi:RNA polymerase sigma-70 factor (ECF subfamily)